MITKISIKNYKSLADVTLTPGPLTVLVGANASGKSNILDALKILKEITASRESLDNILVPRGGYEEAVWGKDSTREISFDLEEDFIVLPGMVQYASYSVTLGHDNERDYLANEEMDVPPLEVSRDKGGSFIIKDSGGQTSSGNVSAEYSALPTSVSNSKQLSELHKKIQSWTFYEFEPRQMRAPKGISREYRINETGSNLSTVIHTLHSDDSPVLDDIVESVKSAVPTVEKLSSPLGKNPSTTYVALKEKGVPEPIGSWGLSDGTLFSLALATTLYTPEMPSLIALESPDTTLHPYVMEHVAEMLKIASKKTQVIVTTHSPYLLNYLPQESLVIVEKTKGKTTLKSLKGRRALKKVIEQLGGGEVWYSGHLGGVP